MTNTLNGVSGTPIDPGLYNSLVNPIQAPQFSNADSISTAGTTGTNKMTYVNFLNSSIPVTELQHLIRALPSLDTAILQSILTGQASNLARLQALGAQALVDYNSQVASVTAANAAIKAQATTQVNTANGQINTINNDVTYSGQLAIVNGYVSSLTTAQRNAILATGVPLPLPAKPPITVISNSFIVNANLNTAAGIAAFNAGLAAAKTAVTTDNTNLTLYNKYRNAFTQIVANTGHTNDIAPLTPQNYSAISAITVGPMSNVPSFSDSSAGIAFTSASTLLTTNVTQSMSNVASITQKGQGNDILTLLLQSLQSSTSAHNINQGSQAGSVGKASGSGGASLAVAGESSAITTSLASSLVSGVISQFNNVPPAQIQAQVAVYLEGLASNASILGIHGATAVIAHNSNGAVPSEGALSLAAAVGNLQAIGVLVSSTVVEDGITLLVNSDPSLQKLTDEQKTVLIKKLVAAANVTLLLNAISVLGQELGADGKAALDALVNAAVASSNLSNANVSLAAQVVTPPVTTTTTTTPTVPVDSSKTQTETTPTTTAPPTTAPTTTTPPVTTASSNEALSSAIDQRLSPTDPNTLAHALTQQIAFTLLGSLQDATIAVASNISTKPIDDETEASKAAKTIPKTPSPLETAPSIGVQSDAFTNPAFPTPNHYTINSATSSAAPTSDTAAVTADHVPVGTIAQDKPTYTYLPIMQLLTQNAKVFNSSGEIADAKVIDKATSDFHSTWENPSEALKNRLDPGKAFWSMVFPHGEGQQPYSRTV